MDSTLLLPNTPLHVRSSPGDKTLASSHLIDQPDGANSVGNGLSGEKHYGLSPSSPIRGGAESVPKYITGTMADLDVSKFPLSEHCAIGRHISETPADGSGSSMVDLQPGSSKTSLRYTTSDTTPSELPSPNTKPGPVRKRGRPRKPGSAASVTGFTPEHAAIKSGRRTSTNFEAENTGAVDPKTLRAREKNRIAADRCRSRRRQQEVMLETRHDDLQQKHRSLIDAQSELMREIYSLKNMLMKHGSCDCRLIQAYLAKSASEWVAKKVEASTKPVGTSPLHSERCGIGMA